MEYQHTSVMPVEVLHYLSPNPGETFVDCTLGGAGHSRAILDRILPGGLLVATDQDPDAITNAGKVLAPYGSAVRIVHGNYETVPEILSHLGIPGVDGILLDLGLSFHQIDGSGRGFSFRRSEPLDMRMDPRTGTTAAELVNESDEKSLARIFQRYGEERFAARIAKRIVSLRQVERIETSIRLAEIVKAAVPAKTAAKQKIHPATRVFQALRIAVNRELSVLSAFMEKAPELLNPGGRLCVLSFHSLEDRIVKHRIRALEKGCTCPPDFPVCACDHRPQVRSLSRKAIRPTEAEVAANPMARSTRLRAFVKL